MNCPLCHSTSPFWVEADQREYHLCPDCRLISAPPRFHLPPDQEVERYLEHENSLDNEGYVNMFQKKIDGIRDHCPDIKTILDFGCGYAPVLKTLLQRAGYKAEGYDPHFFPELKQGSVYDLVVSTETFEHLQHPGDELEKISGLLAPQGYLAVMTQFYPTANGQPDAPGFRKWYYQRDPTHICFYAPKTFEWIAHHHNFDIILNNSKDFVILQKNASS